MSHATFSGKQLHDMTPPELAVAVDTVAYAMKEIFAAGEMRADLLTRYCDDLDEISAELRGRTLA